ncbi:testis-specific serine serine/threonine-protein kinase 1-like [Octopus vulgaris]|uniref:Testis-specific serine serine/threonine-protein kinase 1-like n=2 Tax=Octopus TaxID=6643 RepID=A0AA36BB79_OCTVU|nr:testis-specific serine/threonine-protein kinase 2-like [Octopus sinensis]CAI9730873.1 testis-specific serine serine/threonine-protein kinase 1-like [Octopus vulgaris]
MKRTSNRFEIDENEHLKKYGYTILSTLDEGSFAKVKEGYDENNKRKAAIKIIDERVVRKNFKVKFLPRELAIFPLLDHPNIIKLFHEIRVGHKIYVVMEFAGHGNLLDYVELHGGLLEPKSKAFFSSILSAISYMHSKQIVHRDIKCENILLNRENEVKVSDFGFAREIKEGQLSSTFCGSMAYSCPEILQKKPYYPMSADAWALGIVLFKMVFNRFPYKSHDMNNIIKMQTEKKFTFPKVVSYSLQDMINNILEPQLDKRFGVTDIISHTWIKYVYAEENSHKAEAVERPANTETVAAAE